VKQTVRDRPKEFLAEGVTALTPRVTSGSTGIPLRTYMDAQSRDWMWGSVARARHWWGIDIGDRCARVTTSRPSWRTRARAYLLNERFFSCADLSDVGMDRLYRELRAFRPLCLRGNPHTLAFFAQHLLERHSRLHDVRPKAVFCSAETLYAHQRALLARVFECRVINWYGTNENGFIAAECPEGRLHVMAENVLVEAQPSANPQATWELLVTDLNNHGMPLIRYAVGDLGTPVSERCTCGRGLPLLDLKAGRTGDLIQLRGGRFLDHAVLCDAFEVFGPGTVRQYRIVQETLDRFTVFVATPTPGDEIARAIRRGLARTIGPEPIVDVRFVSVIEPDPAGKLRLFESRLRGGSASIMHG
jgi:phenylacetate-CoA ligase